MSRAETSPIYECVCIHVFMSVYVYMYTETSPIYECVCIHVFMSVYVYMYFSEQEHLISHLLHKVYKNKSDPILYRKIYNINEENMRPTNIQNQFLSTIGVFELLKAFLEINHCRVYVQTVAMTSAEF